MVRSPSLMAEVSATKDGLPAACLKYIKPVFSQPRTDVTVNGVAGDNNPKAEPKNIDPELTNSPILAKSNVEATFAPKASKAINPVLWMVPLTAATAEARPLVLVT